MLVRASHPTVQATLQLNAPSIYLSGLGEELMLWPPNAWKTGGRQKVLPHVKKESHAQVLHEFLISGLHDELGLKHTDDSIDGRVNRDQF